MAIYWVDFSKSGEANGTGTYASPWNGTAKFPIASGDEVRIKSVDLVTMTEFTFTGTGRWNSGSITTLSVPTTSFELGDVIVCDKTKTAGVVGYINDGNYIAVYGQMASYFVFEETDTALTFRKINRAYLSQKDGSINYYLQSTSIVDNVTYTDGWISETIRKTDLSALTICNHTGANGYNMYIGNTTNSDYDLQSTCLIPTSVLLIPNVSYNSWTYNTLSYESNSNTNFYLHQHLGGTTSGQPMLCSSDVGLENCSVTYNFCSSYYGPSHSSTQRYNGTSIIMNNLITQQMYMYSTYYSNNAQLTFKRTFVNGFQSPALYTSNVSQGGGSFTVTFDGKLISGNTPTGLTGELTNKFTLNLTSNFNWFSTSGTPINTCSYMVKNIAHRVSENISFRVLPIVNNTSPTFIMPTNNQMQVHNTNTPPTYSPNRENKMPSKVNDMMVLYDSALNIVFDSNRSADSSYIFINRATQESYEELTAPLRYGSTNYSFIINKDDVNFKTTGPGYSYYLQTFSASYNEGWFNKIIKVPLAGDGLTEFTITGWIKTDAGFFNQGDLEAMIIADNGDIILTNAINIATAELDWSQFTLNVVPSFSQAAELRIRMKPKAGGKTFWLSDIGAT